ncbi:DUF4870 domain-containing protein [Leptospira ilyithenensis]|uniref:DUF4870 domain-containing protein n=1 Tax=Leptospira ilyithenensis TaxID=2484901 RepID=A0A4R9LSB4_9LEPT|nr:DUF4870 domain-containing protein [Leptospira ilyithenensis]TGN11156.1 hypothetical protein EHS11_08360 [Leptospira ilyithenensis]
MENNLEIIDAEEKKWARRVHLTTLLTYPMALLPFSFSWEVLGTFVFPFVIWLSRKKTSYSAGQALEAMYLQALLAFGYIGLGNAFSGDRVLFVFSYVFVGFLHLLLLGFGVFRTTIGKPHHYPFSFFPLLFASRSTKENWNSLKKQFSDKVEFNEYKSYIEKFDSFKLSIEKEVRSLTDAGLQVLGNEFLHSLSELRVKLTEDPLSYKKAKQYLNYFPETTAKILNQYNHVSRDLSLAGDNEKRKTELSQLLQEVIKTTEQVRGKLKADETLNLDVEITAMKKNIGFGGY